MNCAPCDQLLHQFVKIPKLSVLLLQLPQPNHTAVITVAIMRISSHVCLFVCLFGLTALSAQIGYIAP